uniref:Uncharacterized protein n=1 Tax=Arundo donax TaxID=35708 RepID=A0A0A9B1P7_ARUDO
MCPTKKKTNVLKYRPPTQVLH